MYKSLLLAAASILALNSSSTLAAPYLRPMSRPVNVRPVHLPPAAVLYSQNSGFGYGITSTNFTSGTSLAAYNAAGADDFVVPAGHTWSITEVDTTGVYYHGSGPANSEVVTFYKDSGGHPGRIAKRAAYTFTLNCSDNSGSFACTLPVNARGRPIVRLSGGTAGTTWWVSVVANTSDESQWGWLQNHITHNNPGQWENPGNGFQTGCTTWDATANCIPGARDDFAFAVLGTQS